MNKCLRGTILPSIYVVVFRVTLAIAIISILPSGSLLAEDRGAPDSVILEIRLLEGEIINPQRFVVDLYVFNDSNNLASVSAKFPWDNPSIRMDSARSTWLAKDAFDLIVGIPVPDHLFITPNFANEHFVLFIRGSRFVSDGLVQSPDRQLLGSAYFSVTNWSTPDCICFDDRTPFGGEPGVRFVDDSNQAYEPVWLAPVCLFTGEDSDGDGIGNDCQFCCVGRSGNIDCDALEIVDITDLTLLVDHLFVTLEPLCCSGEGNIDGDPLHETDITDLTWLINHLFLSRIPVAECR